MADGRSNPDWDVMRSYVFWLMQHAEGAVTLLLPQEPPRTISTMRTLADGWAFQHRLIETLTITADALRDAAGSLATAHRVAAAVEVAAPKPEEIEQLQRDLRTLSELVKRDQHAAAVSALLASAADRLETLPA
jgi:hypothetical protein